MVDCSCELTVIAGDEFCLGVSFEDADGREFAFGKGDAAEMVLHFGEDERVFSAAEYIGNTAKFLFSPVQTKNLLEENPSGRFEYCVHLFRQGGGRYTPIHRAVLFVVRC